MDNVALLKQRAIEFQTLLEEYAKTDDDVEDFLRRITPWFEKIKNNQIIPPDYDYQLYRYFANPDLSPLSERYSYTDNSNEALLGEACARFTAAIMDGK